MTDTRTPAEAAVARRKQLKRRVKRGIVASYIHQISRRHNNGAARKPLVAEAVTTRPEEQVA